MSSKADYLKRYLDTTSSTDDDAKKKRKKRRPKNVVAPRVKVLDDDLPFGGSGEANGRGSEHEDGVSE